MLLNQQKLEVEKIVESVAGKNQIAKFVVKDELGVKYVFGRVEITHNHSAPGHAGIYTSSWYLTEIVAPSTLDAIILSYESTDFTTLIARSASETLRYPGNYTTIPEKDFSAHLASQRIEGARLKTITFPDGIVMSFDFDHIEREDLAGDHLLRKISIMGENSEKGFELEHDYSLNRATLTKLILFGGSSQTKSTYYEFKYGDPLPDRLSPMQDHWGFFNNNSGEIIPQEVHYINGTNQILPGGNRNTDPTKCLAGSLESISYPTGGRTEFEMEANTATDPRLISQSGTQLYVGGLRVKKISDYSDDSTTPSQVREYEYTLADGSSSGTLGIYPVYTSLVCYEERPMGGYSSGSEEYTCYSPNFISRSSSTVQSLVYANGSPVAYKRVVERVKGDGVDLGRTEWYFSSFQEHSAMVTKPFPFVPVEYKDWDYGLIDSVKMYSREGELVKKENNDYEFVIDSYWQDPNRLENFRSVSIAPVKYILDTNVPYWTIPVYFKAESFYPTAGRSQLVKTTTSEYFSGGVLKTITTKNYDPENYYLKSASLLNSKGESIVAEYSYPKDMVQAGRDPNGTYQAMLDRNILNPAIEIVKSTDAQQTQLIRNNYFNPHPNVYVVESVVVQQFGQEPHTQVKYYQYDNRGRPLVFSKDADVKISYGWGRDGKFPNMEVLNAAINEVHYTSFEEELGPNIITDDSYTGNKCWSGTYVIPAGKRPPLGNYVVDYRERIGSEPWVYKKQLIFNGVPSEIATSGLIDEVRVYPAGAEMRTYSFDPLFGMISSIDPNGVATFYEYDIHGRLQAVIDNENNVTKSFRYNFSREFSNN